ncbi:MAG: T9SS type A sorting domain-containing protein [Flavobacteriales bacterium]|nr:T9SS type A sorting domain-containing protein [Flavobacteriales bacterium]
MKNGLILGAFAVLSFGASAQTIILDEDFESGLPASYTIVDNDGLTPNAATAEFTEAWTLMTDPLDSSDTVMGSTSYFEPVGTADRWLITPPLALGAYGNFIYWDARSHDPSYPDDYQVLVSTTDTQLSSFTDVIGSVQQEYATWYSRSADLSSSGYQNQTIYVAFVNTTDDGFALYVDNIRVEVEDPVGINELNDISLSVYPNPVSNQLNIKTDASIELIEVVSLDGSVLTSSSENQMDVSSLTSGSYLVKVRTNQGIAVRPFVKM